MKANTNANANANTNADYGVPGQNFPLAFGYPYPLRSGLTQQVGGNMIGLTAWLDLPGTTLSNITPNRVVWETVRTYIFS